GRQAVRAAQRRHVGLRFLHSPFADYLFYLLYRDTTRVPGLGATDLANVPTLNTLIALPEIALSERVSSYSQVQALTQLYRGTIGRAVARPVPRLLTYGARPAEYDSLRMIVDGGLRGFEAFRALWALEIEPEELRNIEVWKAQNDACPAIDSLESLTGLSFPSDSLDVGAILMHLSGSGNYSPAGVYTRTFD